MVPAFTRPFWMGVLHAAPAAIGIGGPIYAGAFVRYSADGWKWPFRISAILFGVAGIAVFFFHHTTSRMEALGKDFKSVFKTFDYFGLLIFIGALVSLLMGLSWGGETGYGWSTPHAIAPTVVGCSFLLIALPLWEFFAVKNPLIDLSLFRHENFGIVSIMAFFNGFVLFAISACE